MRFSVQSFARRFSFITVFLLAAYYLSAIRTAQPGTQVFSVAQTGYGRQGFPFPSGPKSVSEKRAAEVIDAFRFAWHGYSTHCFGHDELLPVSCKCGDSRNGWGASIVDALSTALVMGQTDIVHDILNYVPKINFAGNSVWPQNVNLFETTIRYMGGLISAYDLLKSGLNENFDIDDPHVDALLAQAKALADKLKYAFNTSSGLPFNRLWMWLGMDSHASHQPLISLAAAGTLVLEWQRLSDLTGDARYGELAQKAESYILDPKFARPENPDLNPGLLGTRINIETGKFEDNWGSWGSGRDSAYEYLLKMYIYDPDLFATYGERWLTAAESTMANISSHPYGRNDLKFLSDWLGKYLNLQSDHLAAFAAGNFILGGSVYGERKYIDFGLELVNGLHALQEATATGIAPEQFSWNNHSVPADQLNFYKQHGFWIKNAEYKTRPEVKESYYYAYRITKDAKYQDWAWNAFQNILKACKTEWGLSYIEDVNSKEPLGGKKLDFQDSFVFSEVMKYSYLIFAEDAPWQVRSDGKNEFVFNTEGHPLRIVRGKKGR